MAESWENPRSGEKAAAPDRYAEAGVDVAAGNDAVARYRSLLAESRHPGQLDAVGGFAGLFRLPGDEKRALVASTDGVGTKVLLAAELQRYDEVYGVSVLVFDRGGKLIAASRPNPPTLDPAGHERLALALANRRSDVYALPGPLNAALLGVQAVERTLLRLGPLPFGSSVVLVGRKDGPA